MENQNLISADPQLADLLNYYKKLIKLELNCHHIGTIQTFNSLLQTAIVQINYTKTFIQVDSVGKTKNIDTNYPLLLDVPVMFLGGGLSCLTFPITPGDECLLLFNDRDFDNWFAGSSSSPPATGRLHSFPDAVALVGVRSMAKSILDFNATAPELKMGGNKITLAADKMTVTMATGPVIEIDSTGKLKITNLLGDDLISTLMALFTDVQTGLVTTLLGPQPLVMPTFTADLAKLTLFQP